MWEDVRTYLTSQIDPKEKAEKEIIIESAYITIPRLNSLRPMEPKFYYAKLITEDWP